MVCSWIVFSPLLHIVSGAASASWTRGTGAQISVDAETFLYNLTGSSSSACDLVGGGLSYHCGGIRYDSSGSSGSSLELRGSPVVQEGRSDARLGTFSSIRALWDPVTPPPGGSNSVNCSVATEIRYFHERDAFLFVATFAPEDGKPVTGANGTALLPNDNVKRTPDWHAPPSTAFPSWPADGSIGDTCSYLSYQGNSLSRNFVSGPLKTWGGGLEGGPLLLFPTPSTPSTQAAGAPPVYHPPAIVLSPAAHAKAMVGSPLLEAGGKRRVGFGVQGFVEELPAGFEQQVVLVGRPGLAAAQMAWGETIRAHSNTTRLHLGEDLLNRKISYWTGQ